MASENLVVPARATARDVLRGAVFPSCFAARLACAILAAAALVPAVVRAEGRYAIESGFVALGTQPAKHAMLAPDALTSVVLQPPAAARYQVHGRVHGLGSDEIFANGFDLNLAYDITFANDVPLGNDVVVLGSVDVPAGSYVAFVRLQAETGNEPNPGNDYRFDCELSPGFDSSVSRVGSTPRVERYLTYQGTATLDAAGTIQFRCRSSNGHLGTALSGKLTVISVGSTN